MNQCKSTLSLIFGFLVSFLLPSVATGSDARFECWFSVGSHELKESLPTELTEGLQGEWVVPKKWAGYRYSDIRSGIRPGKDAWLVRGLGRDLISLCYQRVSTKITRDSLYFITLDDIRAFKKNDKRCTGHEVIYSKNDQLWLVHRDFSLILRKKLSDYNFGIVLPGMVYRSKKLGRAGIRKVFSTLKEAGLPVPKSIASIHVMGFGGPGGNYNLEELKESEKRGVSFLHSYHIDPLKTVYMDGTDPSRIVEDDPHHGNIYDPKTVGKFLPDKKVRELLETDKSMEANRIVLGDTQDFFQSVENMIRTPWPVLIHCKGGRHKTGMFSLIFEVLAYQSALDQKYSEEVSVPDYKNRFANWWGGKGSFWKALFGGPYHTQHQLAPAETNYAFHNMSVFRRKNIDFVRGVVSGEFLFTKKLQNQWKKIRSLFWQKVRSMPQTFTIREELRRPERSQI